MSSKLEEEDHGVSMRKWWNHFNVKSLDGLEVMTVAPTSEKPIVSRPGAGLIGIGVGDQVSGSTTLKDVGAVGTSLGVISQETKIILAFAAGILLSGIYFKILNP
jgi:hypothetical protein